MTELLRISLILCYLLDFHTIKPRSQFSLFSVSSVIFFA
ncbi:MAG: hypothetical protein HeimC2_40470 [Candidatus Heimdallarchaeota archaeon LC_2]|nr:MAG: hypothetical protein HeimC2_40470 [Candidatus Heimdallarchaeota archaeon LC_2]